MAHRLLSFIADSRAAMRPPEIGCWTNIPPECYGRLAVVSDLDDGGVCPECRQGVERICRAITKQVQRSDARIEVDVMHTWNECTE
jgi:hypothetical protein